AIWRYPSLSDLIGFFRKPAATFLRQRLGLDLYEPDEELPGREPFALEAFVDSELGQQGLTQRLNGGTQEALQILLRARGLLPHGQPGELVFAHGQAAVEQVMARLADTDTAWQSQRFQLAWPDFGLHGVLSQLNTHGRWQVWFGHVGVWQWLEVWITHLALNACHELPQDQGRHTFIHTPTESWVLEPVADAALQLEGLLNIYWQGLQRPLPFFPKSAWAMWKDDRPEPNLKQAETEWQGSDYHAGEGSKAEYALLYRGQVESPLRAQEDAFMALAQQVFGGLQQARRSG
ncbi:MAG: hypothetical protein KDI15_10905, partial [Thiothrix sp.]|nr:hypothetical protein [Thiothrix sp.]